MSGRQLEHIAGIGGEVRLSDESQQRGTEELKKGGEQEDEWDTCRMLDEN